MSPDEKYKEEIQKINIKYWKKLKNLYDEIMVERWKYLIRKSKIREKYDDKQEDLDILIDDL